MDIRRALPADLPAIAAIYGREALEGHATFDLALHRACGFEEVGTMRQAGRTFDQWIDLTWLQKLLA